MELLLHLFGHERPFWREATLIHERFAFELSKQPLAFFAPKNMGVF